MKMTSNIERHDPEQMRIEKLHRQPEVIELFKVGQSIIETPIGNSTREILVEPNQDTASFLLGITSDRKDSLLITRRASEEFKPAEIGSITREGQVTIFTDAGEAPTQNDDSDIDFLTEQLERLHHEINAKSVEYLRHQLSRGQTKRTAMKIGAAGLVLIGGITALEVNGIRADKQEGEEFDSYGYTLSGGTVGEMGESINPEIASYKELTVNPLLSINNIPDLSNSHAWFSRRTISPEDGLREYVLNTDDEIRYRDDPADCVDVPVEDVTEDTVLRAWTDNATFYDKKAGDLQTDITLILSRESINICYINAPERVVIDLENQE